MLARLGAEPSLPYPGGGVFRLRGGHRLWAAPEVPEVSYAPDDHACTVDASESGLSVAAPPDAAGFAKRIGVSAMDHGLAVDHTVTRRGDPILLAPWAITQFPLGGTAILPAGGRGGDGSQADRSLVLWPYTTLDDPRLDWRAGAVLIHAGDGPPLKLGSGPDPRRLGYLRHGVLFTKTVVPADHGDRPDRGAVAQVYIGQGFCELETVGELRLVGDGERLQHREIWTVTPCADLDMACAVTLEGAP